MSLPSTFAAKVLGLRVVCPLREAWEASGAETSEEWGTMTKFPYPVRRPKLGKYPNSPFSLRLLNAPNSEDRGLKVRFSLATIAFDTENQLKCLRYYRRKGKTHLQTPILTINSAFSNLKVRAPADFPGPLCKGKDNLQTFWEMNLAIPSHIVVFSHWKELYVLKFYVRADFQSDPLRAQKWLKSDFWGLEMTKKVTSKSSLSPTDLGVLGSVGASADHKGWGQQLFNFQSPAVHWMARTSSLNCLSCRNPYQIPLSLNPSPLFTEKPFLFTKKCFVGSPAQKSAPIMCLFCSLQIAAISALIFNRSRGDSAAISRSALRFDCD